MSKSNNQLHGKRIEDQIKSVFPGSSDHSRSVASLFDIEDIFDKECNLNTSVKASGSDTICLADARRFFEHDESFRLLVCRYKQIDDIKSFKLFQEVIMDENVLNYLRGNLPYQVVSDYHENIKMFPRGQEVQARIYAKNQKKILTETYTSNLKLNAKIDSNNQRRLQCSLNIKDLYDAFPENVIVHTDRYKGLIFPLNIESNCRKFR